jgi:hypothetical protein
MKKYALNYRNRNAGPRGSQKPVVFDRAKHAAMPTVAIGLFRVVLIMISAVWRIAFGVVAARILITAGFFLKNIMGNPPASERQTADAVCLNARAPNAQRPAVRDVTHVDWYRDGRERRALVIVRNVPRRNAVPQAYVSLVGTSASRGRQLRFK